MILDFSVQAALSGGDWSASDQTLFCVKKYNREKEKSQIESTGFLCYSGAAKERTEANVKAGGYGA
jgi:hypothetical protein